MLEGGAARALAMQTARAAGRQVLRSVGHRGQAPGALLDAEAGRSIHAVGRVRDGSMTRGEAASLVAREATTGAAATAAGATAAVLLVALTGGVAAPAVFVVGAAASIGAKVTLDRWLHVRAPTEIHVRGETSPSA